MGAGRYRKIEPRFWRDERVRELCCEEKLIALYALTAQSNRIGLFIFSPALAAEELGMVPRTFQERFGNVCRTLHWGFDSTSRVLYIPTWWKTNEPEGPNQLKGALSDLREIPASPLLDEFCVNTRYLTGNLPETFTQTLQERYPKPLPIQELELEQERELEQEQEKEGSALNPSLTPDMIVDWWAEHCPSLSQPRRPLSKAIRSAIKAAIASEADPGLWLERIRYVGSTPFLCGQNDRGWRATVTWLTKKGTASKLDDGSYTHGRVKPSSSSRSKSDRQVAAFQDSLQLEDGDHIPLIENGGAACVS